jgi:hypothetical protein
MCTQTRMHGAPHPPPAHPGGPDRRFTGIDLGSSSKIYSFCGSFIYGASSYDGTNWNAISHTSPAVHDQHPACRRKSLLHQRRQRGATLPLGRLSAMGPARRSSARATSWSSPEMPFGSAPTTSSARRARRLSAIGHVELRKGTRRSGSTRAFPRSSTASSKAMTIARPNSASTRVFWARKIRRAFAFTRRREVCGLDLQHHAIL